MAEIKSVPRPAVKSSFDETQIMSSLFRFRDTAHKYHLNCFIDGIGSHAEHLALDDLYKGLQKKQDLILEQIIGYLGRALNAPKDSLEIPQYKNKQQAIELCNEIHTFAKNLIQYAGSNDMPNIENVAQELSGLAAHTKYFLMFK